MAKILDGNKLADEVIEDLKRKREGFGEVKLACVLVGDDRASLNFIKQKEKMARELGVDFRLYQLSEDISNSACRDKITQIKRDFSPQGLLVQLPLPAHLNTQYILDSIPKKLDCDVLSSKGLGQFYTGRSFSPPVVSAIMRFVEVAGLDLKDSLTAVVGAGRLVGKPMVVKTLNQKGTVVACDKNTDDIAHYTKGADIVVSGTGISGFIGKEMIKEGALIVDGGAPEPEIKEGVEEKAGYMTPVPGGVGPLTVAYLFENLFELVDRKA